MNPKQEEFRKFFPGIKKEDDLPDEVLVDESTGFSIRVRKVSMRDHDLRHKLERCYDWTKLKQFLLGELKMFYEAASFTCFTSLDYDLEVKVSSWLHSFNGWGLNTGVYYSNLLILFHTIG